METSTMLLLVLGWFLSGSLTMAFLLWREKWGSIDANDLVVILICGILGLIFPIIMAFIWFSERRSRKEKTDA